MERDQLERELASTKAYYRRELEAAERGRLKAELEQLRRQAQNWGDHKAILLYVTGALALLFVLSFFNRNEADLGTLGQTIVLTMIVTGLVYYRGREKQERRDWKRRCELEERLSRPPEIAG